VSETPETSGPAPPAPTYVRGDSPARPPVLLGCAALAAVAVALIAAGACAVVFFESGADTGDIVVEGGLAPGSLELFAEEHVFLVRNLDGEYFAMDDLDAANRDSERRCRASIVPPNDPDFATLRDRFARRTSAVAAGMLIFFRESCDGAIYDAAGARLDDEAGSNLDRFRVSARADGIAIETGARTCSRREGDDWFVSVDCDR
jgi:hypothetical protein